MYEWNKSSKLSNVSYDIRGIVLQEAERLEKQGIKILKLNIGNTLPFNLFASDTVLETISQHLSQSQGYEYSKGILPARQTISDYYKTKNIDINTEDIYLGNGVSDLIGICMRAFLNNGDEILVPSPDYPLWTALVRLSGGVAVHYACDENNEWNPDISDIKKKITSATKAIVVINPNNPTGAVYSKEILQEIVKVAETHNLLIFSDEIYERVLYDNATMHYMASLSGNHPCVFFNGLSKSYRAPGLRAGWIGIHDPLNRLAKYKEGLNMLSNMRLCSNIPAQWAIFAAVGKDNEIDTLVSPQGRLYKQRKIVLDAIETMEGVSTVAPKGAMYMFPKFDQKKFNIKNDEKLVLDLLQDKHMLLVHGRAFNAFDSNHVRIVFLPEETELQKAMQDMNDFLLEYSQ